MTDEGRYIASYNVSYSCIPDKRTYEGVEYWEFFAGNNNMAKEIATEQIPSVSDKICAERKFRRGFLSVSLCSLFEANKINLDK